MRFPGFSGEWETSELGKISLISKGVGISKEQRSAEGSPCILYGELYTTYTTEIIEEVCSKTDLDTNGLVKSKANDVIIPASGETAIDISTARCVINNNVLLGGDLNIIRLNNHDGKFFSYQLNGVRKIAIAKVAQGVSIVHLHGDALSHITVHYPSHLEQEKISSLLHLIDRRIATQNKVIEDLRSLYDVICQKLYSSNEKKEWHEFKYADLLTISNERNSRLQYTNVLSASQEYGMVERGELNIDIKYDATSIKNYKIVHPNEYVIHLRSFQGGFAYSDKTGICSPAYTILVPNGKLIPAFLKYYFTSTQFINSLRIVTYGIRDGRSISVEEFLQLKISIPTISEQHYILSVMQLWEEKIRIEECHLSNLQKQKQYLLRQMFI